MMQTLTNACVGSLSSFCLYNTNIPTCFTTCTHPALFVTHLHTLTPLHTHTCSPPHTYTSTHTHAHLHTHTCHLSHSHMHTSHMHTSTYHPPETPSVNVTPVSTAVNLSESVTLMCEARGSPRPSIIWTKVSDTLEVDTGYISKVIGQPL